MPYIHTPVCPSVPDMPPYWTTPRLVVVLISTPTQYLYSAPLLPTPLRVLVTSASSLAANNLLLEVAKKCIPPTAPIVPLSDAETSIHGDDLRDGGPSVVSSSSASSPASGLRSIRSLRSLRKADNAKPPIVQKQSTKASMMENRKDEEKHKMKDEEKQTYHQHQLEREQWRQHRAQMQQQQQQVQRYMSYCRVIALVQLQSYLHTLLECPCH